MSIRVRGHIVITRKSSRHGDFNVGDLSTEVGVFEVKDQVIEEFEPGTYSGEFLIQWIAPDSFAWRGKVFVKNRATLSEIIVDNADDETPAPTAPPEPDPIDGHPPTEAAGTGQTQPVPEPANQAAPSPAIAPVATDADLFGELWGLVTANQPVKLDPVAVDRQAFRAQRDRLKALGFRFDAMSQTWHSSKSAPEPRDAVRAEAGRSDQDIPY